MPGIEHESGVLRETRDVRLEQRGQVVRRLLAHLDETVVGGDHIDRVLPDLCAGEHHRGSGDRLVAALPDDLAGERGQLVTPTTGGQDDVRAESHEAVQHSLKLGQRQLVLLVERVEIDDDRVLPRHPGGLRFTTVLQRGVAVDAAEAGIDVAVGRCLVAVGVNRAALGSVGPGVRLVHHHLHRQVGDCGAVREDLHAERRHRLRSGVRLHSRIHNVSCPLLRAGHLLRGQLLHAQLLHLGGQVRLVGLERDPIGQLVAALRVDERRRPELLERGRPPVYALEQGVLALLEQAGQSILVFWAEHSSPCLRVEHVGAQRRQRHHAGAPLVEAAVQRGNRRLGQRDQLSRRLVERLASALALAHLLEGEHLEAAVLGGDSHDVAQLQRLHDSVVVHRVDGSAVTQSVGLEHGVSHRTHHA